jgi:hypothetical protein
LGEEKAKYSFFNDYTILEMKKFISARERINVEGMELFYEREKLDNKKYCGDYHIKNYSKVYNYIIN